MSKRDEISTMGEKKIYNFNLPPKGKVKSIPPATAKKPKAVISSTTIVIPKPRPAVAKRPLTNAKAPMASAPPRPDSPWLVGKPPLVKAGDALASPVKGRPTTPPPTPMGPTKPKYNKISSEPKDAVSASEERNKWFRFSKATSPDTPGGLVWKLQLPKLGMYKDGGKVRGDGMSRVKTKGKSC